MIRASTANVTNVSDSATVQTILAANGNRLGFVIANDSTSVLYLKCGAAATTTDWTWMLLADETIDHVDDFIYTGPVTGIWSANASGYAHVTEFE